MRASGLPNFRKMYAKNEKEDLPAGTYTIDIDMSKFFFLSFYFGFILCECAKGEKKKR